MRKYVILLALILFLFSYLISASNFNRVAAIQDNVLTVDQGYSYPGQAGIVTQVFDISTYHPPTPGDRCQSDENKVWNSLSTNKDYSTKSGSAVRPNPPGLYIARIYNNTFAPSPVGFND